MARSPSAPVNGRTLASARLQAGHTVGSVAKRLNTTSERVTQWEQESSKPTLVQLRTLARLFGTTTAALLSRQGREFPGQPDLPDFRRDHRGEVSTAVISELRKARDRRTRLLDLSGPTGQMPDVRLSRDTVEVVANAVRALSGISVDDQRRFRDVRAALNAWITAVEGFGIMVSQTSGIPATEFLGMSMYFDTQSLVLLNGSDEPQRRIFTLFHELGHLLSHTSGICDVYTQSETESVCNSFAAAFLLPREALLTALGNSDATAALDRLSARFRVSQSAVAVQLHACDRMSSSQLGRQLAIARAKSEEKKEKQDARPGFVPPHILKLRNLGETYVSVVLEALHSGSISPVDASYFLEAKLPTVDKMELEIERRAVGR